MAIVLGSVVAYIATASTASPVDRAQPADRPAFANPFGVQPTWEPGVPREFPSISRYSGIENDLDGNSSALRSSDAPLP